MRSTRAIIYKNNFIHNINVIRSFLAEKTKLCITVKANGYGSDSVVAAKTALENGASCVAVATVGEAKVLRENGIASDILLLSLCNKEEVPCVVLQNLSPFVFDTEYIKLLEDECLRQGKKLKVHLAVDTGMGRLGCKVEDAPSLARKISSSSVLELAGTCTHFAISDEDKDDAKFYTMNQIDLFNRAVKSIESSGINPGLKHCSASAGIFSYKSAHFDMVRSGISYYGYSAGTLDKTFLKEKGLSLKPVLSLMTKVSAIKDFSKGMCVSYGCTWEAKEDCQIAVLPIGYADGLFRLLSPGLMVSINGKKYPVVGRICMDQCMVNLGKNSGVSRYDDVIIFGDLEKGALQTASDVAKIANTISYEILTSVSNRVERVIVE